MFTRRHLVSALAGAPALAALAGQAAAQPASGRGRPELRIAAKSKLLMIGDSITDFDRARPIGEGPAENALGHGYVMMVDSLLGAVYPERRIRVVNMGVSGNFIDDLKQRWQTDVIDLHPDWVSIMIGANDVWYQIDAPNETHRQSSVDDYERTLLALVATTKPLVKGLVLMTPFYLQPNRQDEMRAAMDRYSAVVRRVATAHDLILVDTQAAFEPLLEVYYPATIERDRVHPDPIGSAVLARAFLTAIGFDWQRGL